MLTQILPVNKKTCKFAKEVNETVSQEIWFCNI